MTLTSEQYDLWGSSNDWSTAITGASATSLGLPGYRTSGRPEAELCARSFLSEVEVGRSTNRRLYHGGPGHVSFVEGKVVRLPLTALSSDKAHARTFASGDRGVLITFERGIRAMRYSPIEWITAGAFRVVSVKETKDPFWGTRLTAVTLADAPWSLELTHARGGGAAGAAPARQAPRIYDPDVVDRIGEVEGPRWAKMQRTGSGLGGDPAKNGTSVRAFVDAWKVLQAELAASPGTTWTDRLNPQDFGGPGSDGSIYGEGGYARYVVRPDGEVCLLRWSTRPEKLELAERVGFRVVG